MTEPASPVPSVVNAVPSDAWLPVADELIAGIHHTLNNRIGTLQAVLQVLETEIPADHPLRGALGDELRRLERTNGMLALLPTGREARPEPIQLSALLPPLLDLLAQHHGVRDQRFEVEGAEAALPLWADPRRLGHLLLVLLADAGEAARERGDTEVRLVVSGDEHAVRLRITPGGAAREQRRMPLEPWLREMGGEWDDDGSADALQLQLPSLPEVRRRERR